MRILTLLLILVSSANFTFGADLINEICQQTVDPSLCSNSLRSDPRSANANLTTLGRISIKNAQKSAKAAKKLIHKAINSSSYTQCVALYDDAISNTKKCKKALKSRDYGQLNTFVSAAMTDASLCDGSFGRGVQGPPQLKFESIKLQGLCNIILVISNSLSGVIKLV
ncbi:putative pectinesterase inhibitor domain-containing protein [Helianthus annuus]|uniref:pectinesterase inhibitor-like n=1 Tax=Helianthus annuus TaxID=4232 RepID=UPI000B903880|nr:pectinesterase inhibitor-like [Helianthus annuus]KAJ0950208.1 putative pectinesterase inhibitor domain-containing protein [Helianthus annuus]